MIRGHCDPRVIPFKRKTQDQTKNKIIVRAYCGRIEALCPKCGTIHILKRIA